MDSDVIVGEADSVGQLILPASLSLIYAVWLWFSVGWNSTNAAILALLGLLTIAFSPVRRSPALLPAVLLGFYQFGVIGLLALGLALSESASWRVIIGSMIWTLIGWRCLAGVAKRRQQLVRAPGVSK